MTSSSDMTSSNELAKINIDDSNSNETSTNPNSTARADIIRSSTGLPNLVPVLISPRSDERVTIVIGINYLVSRTTDTQVEEELNFEFYNTQTMESSPYLLETTRIPPDPGEFPRNSKNGQPDEITINI